MTFDYIIVGAGSAGSVLAARLTEDAAINVLLLEAGGANQNPLITIPMGNAKIFGNQRFFWKYDAQPEPELPNRPQEILHGRGLGGSSSINGMLFVRGNAGDYDGWAALGNEGWAYRDVLPYFKRLETRPGGDPAYRGQNGPIVARSGFTENPLYDAFHEAVQQAGHPVTEDYNGASQWGVSRLQHSITQGRARRSAPATAYLRPAMRRKNLHVRTHAKVTKVLFEGSRAVGVEYLHRGQRQEARAGAEVILSAGAYLTPRILMSSGIGAAAHLRDHAVPVVADLPGVGQNLQDHLGSFVQRACTLPVTLFDTMKPWGQAKAIAQYLISGTGPLSHYPIEVLAFLKSDPALAEPDLQFFMAPFLRATSGSSMGSGGMAQHGYCISWCQLRPASLGSVQLASSDPTAAPRVFHNYLGEASDRTCHRRAVEIARELHKQAAFDPYRGAELDPGDTCADLDAVDAYLRQTCHTHFHPAGTAKMGHDDMAVVDDQLRVHGIEGLRVVDASIMPRLVSANTNIPVIMIAEKASDLILNRAAPTSHSDSSETGA